MNDGLPRLHRVIESAGAAFRDALLKVIGDGGLTRDQCVRYLQMQFHLTRDVQRYFMIAAAHPSMAGKQAFRDFLYRFALEEEPHYGADVGAAPLDVRLWHAHFTALVRDHPYQRLGAASVLETIGTIASDVIKPMLANAKYLAPNNTRFVVIHMHETLPHGAQFLLELRNSQPSENELDELVIGAREGAILYLRMARGALHQDDLQNAFAE